MAMTTALGMLLAGGLILACAAPAAGQTAAPDAPAIHATDAEASRDTFRAHVRTELADWQIKMEAFDKRAKASGERHTDAAGRHLRSAWNRTEAEGQKVEAATAQGWDVAKASYQTASHDLSVAWSKVRI